MGVIWKPLKGLTVLVENGNTTEDGGQASAAAHQQTRQVDDVYPHDRYIEIISSSSSSSSSSAAQQNNNQDSWVKVATLLSTTQLIETIT